MNFVQGSDTESYLKGMCTYLYHLESGLAPET